MATAADSSTLIAFFQGDASRDVDACAAAMRGGTLVLPPVVLSEVLSETALPPPHRELIRNVAMLESATGIGCALPSLVRVSCPTSCAHACLMRSLRNRASITMCL